MEEKLNCSRETSKAIRALFRRNHEYTPEMMLEIGGENLDVKVGKDTLKGRRRKFGPAEAWKRIFKALWGKAIGGEGKRKKWEDESVVRG